MEFIDCDYCRTGWFGTKRQKADSQNPCSGASRNGLHGGFECGVYKMNFPRAPETHWLDPPLSDPHVAADAVWRAPPCVEGRSCPKLRLAKLLDWSHGSYVDRTGADIDRIVRSCPTVAKPISIVLLLRARDDAIRVAVAHSEAPANGSQARSRVQSVAQTLLD